MFIGAESELDSYSYHAKLQRSAALFLTQHSQGYFPLGSGKPNARVLGKSIQEESWHLLWL
jgi:hypothetical protein